jgi:hypothetical protein
LAAERAALDGGADEEQGQGRDVAGLKAIAANLDPALAAHLTKATAVGEILELVTVLVF